ncbi:hypothetical protein Tco_0092752 [Tanacetum coccineum]
MKVEESLNVTFDETPPSPKTSPLEDDDLVEEEAIEVRKTRTLGNDIEDKYLENNEIIEIKSLLEVTAVKLVLLVQKLLLLVLKVNATGKKVTTAERIKTAQRKDKDCLWDMYEIFL